MARSSRAFTLVELLVVMSIIAVLASVILVAVQGARQKGLVAGDQQFDDTNYHGLYSNLVLDWDFNSDTFPIVLDKGPNNINMLLTNVLNGTDPSLTTTPNPFSNGQVLSANTGGAGVDSDPNPKTAVSSSTPGYVGDFSISFWLYTTGVDAFTFMHNTYGAIGTWRFAVHSGAGGPLYFDVKGETGSANLAGPVLGLNQWYQIVGVCSAAAGKVGLYVNGTEFASASIAGSCGYNTNPIHIDGAQIAASNFYTYYVDNVRLYNTLLPVSFIQQEYFAELPKFKSLAMGNKYEPTQ